MEPREVLPREETQSGFVFMAPVCKTEWSWSESIVGLEGTDHVHILCTQTHAQWGGYANGIGRAEDFTLLKCRNISIT